MKKSSSWKSLSEAAQIIGVHSSTLRRWADDGLIEFVRTPGGKRKFQEHALEEFIERHRHHHQQALALSNLEDAAITKTRENLRSLGLSQQTWYIDLTDEQRTRMRNTGNRLVALMLQFCARSLGQDVFLDEARQITREYGRICYATGFTVSECINTFLLFRRPMINAIHATSSLQGMSSEEDHRLFERMTVFLDEIMVTMVEEFNQQDPITHPNKDV